MPSACVLRVRLEFNWMGRSFGSRTLLTICGALVVLLAALAAIQYNWSSRVAAADAQREKEHLDSSASLFASEFNSLVAEATTFLQNDAWSALKSDERLPPAPKLIADLYYLEIPEHGERKSRRLNSERLFVPAPLPDWINIPRCATMALEQPSALGSLTEPRASASGLDTLLVAPLYKIVTAEIRHAGEISLNRTLTRGPEQCFVARIDREYLRATLFPQLIRRSFGETAANEYHFVVVSRGQPDNALYGALARADLKKPFFSLEPIRPPFSAKPSAVSVPGRSMFFVRHMESTIIAPGTANLADLFGPGIWELDIAHKGIPLMAAFEQTRRRNLLLSLAVELLLVLAIVFIVLAARRIQQLADQKMNFVAGVSHELRTPVSAIAMLARNQADGLVAGADRVKQYGELIHQQSRRLNEMVEQTLQYAGIHSGLRRPAKNEIDLRRLIQEAVDARRADLSHSGFEVEISLDPDLPPVPGDAALLRTAFDNLLSNAQKYAEGGRWIRVTARYFAPEKQARISVEDRGAGIDPADQAEIFEPFSRGRAAIEAQIPGSGLGLSLVRSAAEAHRGSVTLVSEPGRGSTFTLHLPV